MPTGGRRCERVQGHGIALFPEFHGSIAHPLGCAEVLNPAGRGVEAVTERLRLKPREERRLRGGHVWIYSNEIDTAATPLKAFAPGDEAVLENAQGRPLGRVLVSPQALICARLFSRDPKQGFDEALVLERLRAALTLREACYGEAGCYRLVYGESDGLSGLVIDRFGPVVVVQTATAGMDRHLPLILSALETLLAPRSIVLKQDSGARSLEGLEETVVVYGQPLDDAVPLEENGVRFLAPVLEGQKTGWFYDHRENRARLASLAKGARVLDAFSYVGAWGLTALAQGADALVAVDGSQRALEHLDANAAALGLADRVETVRGDAFKVLEAQADAGERFDVVIVDPPALIKRRKDLKAGQHGYERLARQALRLTAPGGLCLFASCSLHYDRTMMTDTLRSAARHTDRSLQMLWSHGAGLDHPVHPAIPETDYLKATLARVSPPGRGGAF